MRLVRLRCTNFPSPCSPAACRTSRPTIRGVVFRAMPSALLLGKRKGVRVRCVAAARCHGRTVASAIRGTCGLAPPHSPGTLRVIVTPRINEDITGHEVLLVQVDGSDHEIVPRLVPLADALALARTRSLDLVELSRERAMPSPCRVMDYTEYLRARDERRGPNEPNDGDRNPRSPVHPAPPTSGALSSPDRENSAPQLPLLVLASRAGAPASRCWSRSAANACSDRSAGRRCPRLRGSSQR